MTAPTPEPYLPVWAYLEDDLGVGAHNLEPGVLLRKAAAASELIDVKTGNRYRFLSVKKERHRWRGDLLTVHTYKRRVRAITQLYLVLAVAGGRKSGIGIPVTPPGESEGPDDLPMEWGDVTLTRETSTIQGGSLSSYLTGAPLLMAGMVPLRTPMVEVSYTCGYDGGDPTTDPPTVVAPDGWIWPYPYHIREACRIIMADLINTDWDNKRGMGGLMALQVGTRSYRRMPIRPHVDYSMPVRALQLLEREDAIWVA